MYISFEYNIEIDKEYYLFTDLNYRYEPGKKKGKNHVEYHLKHKIKIII